MKKKKVFQLLLLIFVLVGSTAAIYFFVIKPKFSPNNQAFGGQNAVEVTVVTARKESVQLFQELPARISAYKISEVRPQVEGIIKSKKFTEGSFVKEGQQLYQIDPNIYQIAYDNASMSLKATQAKKERYEKLLELDAVSKQEYDDVSAASAQSLAELKKAKTNLAYTKVLAPISGYIGKSNITEGRLVTANQAEILTTITQLDPIYVDMTQATKDALKIGDQKGAIVTLITDDGEYESRGSLRFTESFADESTDSVRLRALFSNTDKKLIPGMFVTAKIHLKDFDAITIPQRAANRTPSGDLAVFVVDENNVIKMRVIKSSQSFEDKWIVEDGIEEGETIVYEGFQKIADGAKVNPAPLKPKEITEEKIIK